MKTEKKFQGTIVPVVAPLTHDFKLDKEAVERIFSHLYKSNASPFILGTTGESASLPQSYKEDYIKAAAKIRSTDVKLYAGISSNILAESIEFAKLCFNEGVDAVAATLPTYYHLSEEQMKRYFLELADEIPGPLIIYNIPATTHMSIPLSLMDELSLHPNIVGAKDSERSEKRLDDSLNLWKHRPDFSYFLGWAAKSAHALINGADGLVPSTGNITPSIYAEMCKAVLKGDEELAFHYQSQSDKLGHLYQHDRSLGESLWALKVLMNELGLCESHMMPPLCSLSLKEENELRKGFHELIKKEKITLNLLSHAS
ncbi:dihydrodipicolinate synthase family protein [Pedobacter puniceum]|jgi:4-hydroxy-tetrahydrodipicolinate synthase|uniref:Dihydrodipicolinate synthase family protein n=1 Tax=Pedobacter puniceum TaxID=2666136 RepID=A0A7K0FKQ3_9SPHI|nr:dihydrodipicolinate synthase family protein [Pedobacter puniceum]MRX46201.1 dihydrodipicolinate synthase family protein [Pedobacter puniceum]